MSSMGPNLIEQIRTQNDQTPARKFMVASVANPQVLDIPVLLRGEAEPINQWIDQWRAGRVLMCLGIIVLGMGLFGAAIGFWRAPLQALYTAIKFPLVILMIAASNALLNGMLAPLLGLNLRFRQSFLAMLMSFTIAAAILGAFSPLIGFLVWNTPPRGVSGEPSAYSLLLLALVAAIAFAGVAANLRLLQLLRRLSANPWVAFKVLLAWLAGNLFLGSQLCWILRPFVGSPGLPIQFLRPDALRGNFYEGVYWAVQSLLFPN